MVFMTAKEEKLLDIISYCVINKLKSFPLLNNNETFRN